MLHFAFCTRTIAVPSIRYNEVCYLPQDYLERLEQDAHKSLENVLSAEEKTRYRATLVLRQGNAAQEILACLNEQPDIDLIVMATHGRGGVARLMLGSVADKIVRAAPCPVVTLRIPEARESETSPAA